MHVTPYLSFDGTCEEAFTFYAAVLTGKIEALMRFEGSPMAEHVPADWRSKVMHAGLSIGDQALMGSDGPPGRYERPQGFAVSLQIDDAAEAERVFDALAEGGTITMPLGETFWALRFGMLVDRFGTPWMVNCNRPE